MTPGGAVGMDVSFMAYPVIAIGILGHLDAGTTISIASAVGVLGSLTFNVTNIIASLTADKITGALRIIIIKNLRLVFGHISNYFIW